jgi:hypothetical protein
MRCKQVRLCLTTSKPLEGCFSPVLILVGLLVFKSETGGFLGRLRGERLDLSRTSGGNERAVSLKSEKDMRRLQNGHISSASRLLAGPAPRTTCRCRSALPTSLAVHDPVEGQLGELLVGLVLSKTLYRVAIFFLITIHT